MRCFWTPDRIALTAAAALLCLCSAAPPGTALLLVPSMIITLGKRFPWLWIVLLFPLRLSMGVFHEEPPWIGFVLQEGQRGVLTAEVSDPPMPVHLTGSLVEARLVSARFGESAAASASGPVMLYVEAEIARTVHYGDLLDIPFQTLSRTYEDDASTLNKVYVGDLILKLLRPVSAAPGNRKITSRVIRSRAHHWVRERFSHLTWESQVLLSSLMLGSPLESRDPLIDRCREAGVSHVIALSGLHAGILMSMCMLISSPVLGKRGGKIVSLVMLSAFLWFAGPRSSLIRSALMCWTFAAARAAGRKAGLLDVLCIACIIHVSIIPSETGTLSFRLSYAAVLGLVLFWSLWHDSLPCVLPPCIRGAIAASLAASCTAWPMLAAHGIDIRPAGIIFSLPSILGAALLIWVGCAYLIMPSSYILEFAVNRTARSLQLLWEAGASLGDHPAASPAVWMPVGIICLTILLFLQYGRARSAAHHAHAVITGTSLQLAGLDPGFPPLPGPQADQAVWAELPHQPVKKEPDHR